jgi:hypothetical protein
MNRVRRVLGSIAAAWLCCHAATLTLVPVVLWPAARQALECRCSHGDHALCPMHHTVSPGSTSCVLQSTANDETSLLGSLFVTAGIVPAPPQPVVFQSSSTFFGADTTATSRHSAPPGPPPRA